MAAVAAAASPEEPMSPSCGRAEGFGGSAAKLEHLQGARCVATIFVLYHHDWYFSGGARSWFGRNGLAAVDFFVVLSGFATHWSSRRAESGRGGGGGGESFSGWLGWCRRRAEKAVAAVWVTMALDALVFCYYEKWEGCDWFWFGGGGGARAARCLLLVNWWMEPHTLCPNNSAWTVGALLPCWCIVYPGARWIAARLPGPRAAAAVAVVFAVAPVLLCVPAELARSGVVDRPVAPLEDRLQYVLYCGLSGIPPDSPAREHGCYPLSVPLNFVVGVLGAAVAAALRRAAPTPGRRRRAAAVADVAACAVLGAVLSMPSDVSKRRVATHALVPLHLAFIVASTAHDGDPGRVARVLSSKPLAALGSYASIIYLLEFPLARLWKNAFDHDPHASLFTYERFPPKTPAFLAALLLASAAYVDRIMPLLRSTPSKRKAG